jgi:AraC-like DNA-binding protein/quercetin dioxygenase-like cupin family protein
MKPHFKPIQADESNLFKAVIQENEKEFEYPWHYHPEFELTYILTSHGVRYVGNSMENFQDNDLVLIGSNLPHCWINAEEHQQSSAIVIYLKKEFVDCEWMKTNEFAQVSQLFELSKKGVKFSKDVALKLKQLFFQLLTAQPFEKMILLLQILHELAQTKKSHTLCDQGFTYNLNTSNNERINIIYKYIQQHYHEKISLTDIATEVHMSEEYFSRYFSKVMKKTFFEYLNEYKINRACKLLIETDKQISEICYDSGFESIPFFYRQFKRFKLCQPKSYRLNYQKASS